MDTDLEHLVSEFFYRYCGLMIEELTALKRHLGSKKYFDLVRRIENSGGCDGGAAAERRSLEVLNYFDGWEQVDMHDHRRAPLRLKLADM